MTLPTSVTIDAADALTRADIERGTCKRRGCDHKNHGVSAIRAQCHPHAAFDVVYYAGVLTLRCARCMSLVNRILVAAEPASMTPSDLVAKTLS